MKTNEVAQILKLSPRRVQARAQRYRIGRKMPYGYEFSEEDVEKLKPGPTGRPRKTGGNYV